MKTIIKILLGISIVLLGYFCVSSVLTPIQFEEERAKREEAVIASLMNIRKAQLEYKNVNGVFTASFDTLISFVRDGKMKMVKKEGNLTDQQLEKGMTEAKALAIIKKGNAKEIAEEGLVGFSRDTFYVSVLENIFAGVYDAQSLDGMKVIPFANGAEFEMETTILERDNGIKLPLFEVRAPYDMYLGDMDKQELINLIDLQTKLEKYPGLKVGSVTEPNNNAGNWEF